MLHVLCPVFLYVLRPLVGTTQVFSLYAAGKAVVILSVLPGLLRVRTKGESVRGVFGHLVDVDNHRLVSARVRGRGERLPRPVPRPGTGANSAGGTPP